MDAGAMPLSDLPADIMEPISFGYTDALTGGPDIEEVDARRVIKMSETDKRVEGVQNAINALAQQLDRLDQWMGRMEDLLIALQTGKSLQATNDKKRPREDTAEVTEHQAKRPKKASNGQASAKSITRPSDSDSEQDAV
ncbi:hypothetical protein SUNI508_05473 [Seiridium unicorne]|uniref:Uncharacterized protein n=1 Tax=Seiridium unicorne TaxID=138068 RepID=A0ABR2V4P5_9PEZI